jgi:hypothetical protein
LLAEKLACQIADRDAFLPGVRLKHFSHIRFNLNFVVTTSKCSLHVYSLESIRVVCRIMGVPERSDGFVSQAEIKGIRVLLVGFLKRVPNHPDK